MNFRNHQKGFTFIETLVGTAVFLLVSLTAYGAFGVLMDAVRISKVKVAATSIANERLEIIRNLPYTDVGIIAGLPSGKIARTQNITRGGFSFEILTTIRNVDDTFDGTIEGSPTDTSPADYKLVDLDITCNNCKTFSPLKFTTLIAPHALETASTNGALFIRVFNTDGQPIQGASVSISNTQANPDITINDTTDNDGWLKIIDAPPGTNTYSITATKTGFSQDQTYPIGGIAGPTPVKPDATVVLQQVTQSVFSIDLLGSLNISTVDPACTPIPDINFSITGTKLIGTPSILKYETQNFSTNSSGTRTISNLENDTYQVAIQNSYDIAGGNIFPTFNVEPGEDKNAEIIIVPHSDLAMLISVKDNLGNPIDDASVQLQKNEFNETKTTGEGSCNNSGQVFWNGLSNGTYDLTISKTGFTTLIDSITINTGWQNYITTLSS